MPLSESLLQTWGGLSLPAVENATDDTLTSLDPARDMLLALFKAAVNSEFGAAWTAVVTELGSTHPLYGTQPIQDTLPFRPTEQNLTQRKSGWPLLAIHRDGRGEFADFTLERDKLTQPWKLHWILGPADIIDQRRLLDVGQAIAKVIRLVICKRGHKAYQDGALQFFGDTSALASIELTGYVGPDQAGFAGDKSTTIFWALEADIVTTELSDYVDGSEESDLEALDLSLGVGGGEGLLPELVLAQSDQDPDESP